MSDKNIMTLVIKMDKGGYSDQNDPISPGHRLLKVNESRKIFEIHPDRPAAQFEELMIQILAKYPNLKSIVLKLDPELVPSTTPKVTTHPTRKEFKWE